MIRSVGALIPDNAIPNMDDRVIEGILRDVGASARNKWLKFAERDSSSFRTDYMQGISPVTSRGKRTQVVSLVGEVAHLLEDGAPRVDMRDTLLGPNVPVVPRGERGKHLSKNKQFYRAIPFRHTLPGTSGAVGQAMGSAYTGHDAVSDAKKLGNAVYRAAKKLAPTTTDPYSKQTKWGGWLKTHRLRSGISSGKGVPLLKPHHKSSIFEGMVRQEKTYEKATQSQYTTFRTISTAVRDGSWIRKPIAARKYAEKVSRFVADVLPRAIAAYVEGQK